MKRLLLTTILLLLASPVAAWNWPVITAMQSGGGGETTIPTPTAHYLFENDATDETSNHDATATAGFTYDGTNYWQGSYAGNFDNDDYVYVADHSDFDVGTGDWSMSAVVRTTYQTDATLPIFSKYGWDSYRSGIRLWIANGSLILSVDDNADGAGCDTDSGFDTTVETAYHIVVTFDASETNEITWYVSSISGTFGDQLNGTSGSCDSSPPDNTFAFEIGAQSLVDELDFFGQIDDFRWYKGTVLSATEAEAIYDLY